MIDTKKPTEEFLRNIDIHELLPQQEPFVMISRIVHFDMEYTETETKISKDNLFVEGMEFTSGGLIENIAQTCAARIGYINKYILHKDIQRGYIGAINNLHIFDYPTIDEIIHTSIQVKDEIFGMILAQAEIKGAKGLYVSTDIKIAIKEEKDNNI